MSGDSFLGVASPTSTWSSIWRCRTLSKVQHFLWRCCFHALPVRVALLARGCAVSPICPRCGLQEESMGIWKARNRLVFEGVLWRPEVVVQTAVVSFWEFHDARSLCSSVQPRLAGELVESWSPPPLGFVKCNFDAAFCRQSSQEGGAAVFRDFRGAVLRAVIFRPFSAASALEAEALVCQRAILCAIDLRFSSLWFESDAKAVVDGVLCQQSCPSEIASICFDIARDLRRFSSTRLTHVR
ncbi:uncharacterized protein LOC132281833 [Cornus florida]|uniref:uncharacterized protein LOC132281833 n=1 Tax=Cornus florida TaxID=4283 RepID=UPI0028981F81|nr:uncharacterized protein LOC132281833 [Cornus florida]